MLECARVVTMCTCRSVKTIHVHTTSRRAAAGGGTSESVAARLPSRPVPLAASGALNMTCKRPRFRADRSASDALGRLCEPHVMNMASVDFAGELEETFG